MLKEIKTFFFTNLPVIAEKVIWVKRSYESTVSNRDHFKEKEKGCFTFFQTIKCAIITPDGTFSLLIKFAYPKPFRKKVPDPFKVKNYFEIILQDEYKRTGKKELLREIFFHNTKDERDLYNQVKKIFLENWDHAMECTPNPIPPQDTLATFNKIIQNNKNIL